MYIANITIASITYCYIVTLNCFDKLRGGAIAPLLIEFYPSGGAIAPSAPWLRHWL